MYTYHQTLGVVCAGLTLKMAVVNLLTARCRTSTGIGRAAEDTKDKFIGLSFFRVLMLGYGPLCDADAMERLISCSRNSAENEPFFALAALGWAAVTTPPAYAPALLVLYMLSRYIHTMVYIFVRRQPYRALAWAPGMLIMLYISGHTLISAPNIWSDAFRAAGESFKGNEL